MKKLDETVKKGVSILKSREVITYIIFGILTTVVNYLSYYVLCNLIGMDPMIGNAIAWVFAVVFAYVTNNKLVFLQKKDTLKEETVKIIKFFGARVLSFAVEELGILIFVEVLGYNGLIVKAVLAVVVIVMNYILSKFYIFKK
jgi:putative flippase GtrA